MNNRVNLESMSIQELSAMKDGIDWVIKKKMAEEARKRGETFARLEDIPPKGEHAHKFIWESRIGVDGQILTGSHNIQRMVPSRYACACGEQAYSCNNCGYVSGEPTEEKFDTIARLSGSAGLEYSCRICGEYLGTTTEVVS